MQPGYKEGIINSNIKIGKNIYKMKVNGNFKGEPGQFYMLRAWDKEPFLSRPLSISNLSNGFIEFLYEVKGKGTRIFSRLKSRDSIYLLGPLGNGFNTSFDKKVGIISGGIGIAPMIYLAKKLGKKVDFYVGFRDDPYCIKDIEYYVNKLHVATENGSVGHKGYIVDIFSPEKYTQVLACGPLPMLKRVVSMCKEKNTPVYVSMENRMACGTGACLGCTIETIEGMKRVCKEGPVFSGEEIIFYD